MAALADGGPGAGQVQRRVPGWRFSQQPRRKLKKLDVHFVSLVGAAANRRAKGGWIPRMNRECVKLVLESPTSKFGEGYRLRLREMDVTDVRADGEFYAKMIERGVFTAEEVRGMVEGRD